MDRKEYKNEEENIGVNCNFYFYSLFVLWTDRECYCFYGYYITYFEDGSYVVDLIEASPILVRGSVYTRTGSKTRTFYDSDNVVKWKFIVYGTFEVNSGVSAKCTKATCNTEIYDSNWKVISQSAWPSGNQAIGTATLKRYLLGIPVRTEEVTVTLTCDKNGTLS